MMTAGAGTGSRAHADLRGEPRGIAKRGIPIEALRDVAAGLDLDPTGVTALHLTVDAVTVERIATDVDGRLAQRTERHGVFIPWAPRHLAA
jgi:hypothetical protein